MGTKEKKVSLKFALPKISLPKFNFKLQANFKSPKALEMTMGILAYIPVLFIVPIIYNLIIKNATLDFHIRQGLSTLILYVLGLFSFFLSPLPILFILMILVAIVIGIVNVVFGREKPLPLIGKLAL